MMAEEPTETPKETPPEKREKEREEPTTVVKEVVKEREEPTQPTLVDCPECDLPIREDKLGSHRFKAHEVERRKPRETTTEPDDGKTKPPPRRNVTEAKPDNGQTTKKRKPTRVSRSWFGGSAENDS
jgi:hypothetical protein